MATTTSSAPRGGLVMTIKEACAHVGVCRRTMHNWIAAGKVDVLRTAGGSARIYVDTLYRPAGSKARVLSPLHGPDGP